MKAACEEPLRIVFFGTAEFACPALEALAQAPFGRVVAVVTQPDRPKGRELRIHASPVKALAVRLGLPVLQPERCRAPEFLDQFRALRPDLAVVAAYGQLLPPALLEVPRLGCLNIHASLLPKYRGAAPIQWAILNDEPETGVTIMRMDAGLDTGPMLARRATPILSSDDAQSLHDRLAQLGADLLVEVLPEHAAGRLVPQPQPAEGATHARKITKEDGRLDWVLPARALRNRVRAFRPWPGAFTSLPSERGPVLLKVWRCEVVPATSGKPGEVLRASPEGIIVRCGEDALLVTELQREGGRRLASTEFLAGHTIRPGTMLG